MPNSKKPNDLDSFLEEIIGQVDQEIESERLAQLSSEDRELSRIASEILRLERDMTKPGEAVQDSTRIDRLTKFIDEAKF